jgi:hypothetical protein
VYGINSTKSRALASTGNSQSYPPETNTFDIYEDALKWARSIETDIDRGLYFNRTTAEQLTLRQALDRYAKEVTPSKRGAKDECIRIKALQRRKFASHSLATLTPRILAEFRMSASKVYLLVL